MPLASQSKAIEVMIMQFAKFQISRSINCLSFINVAVALSLVNVFNFCAPASAAEQNGNANSMLASADVAKIACNVDSHEVYNSGRSHNLMFNFAQPIMLSGFACAVRQNANPVIAFQYLDFDGNIQYKRIPLNQMDASAVTGDHSQCSYNILGNFGGPVRVLKIAIGGENEAVNTTLENAGIESLTLFGTDGSRALVLPSTNLASAKESEIQLLKYIN